MQQEATAESNKEFPFIREYHAKKAAKNNKPLKGGQRVEPARREKGLPSIGKGFSLKAKERAEARREDLRKDKKGEKQ